MKACGECIHYPVCRPYVDASESFSEIKDGCSAFTDKSRFVEQPCDKGDILMRGGKEFKVDHFNNIVTAFAEDGTLGLFDCKEIKEALKERE